MKAMTWALRMLRGFGRFWWDFLVGDTPEIFLAALVVLGIVALVSLVGHWNALAVVALPLLAILTLGLSIVRASRARRG